MKRYTEEQKQRLSLSLLFTALVFLLLLVTMAVVLVAVIILIHAGVLSLGESVIKADRFILWIALISVVAGTILSTMAGRIPLRSVNAVIDAMNALASGKYGTRLSFKSRLGRLPAIQELTDSFNTMARELESTEELRSDFINDFSHEFKTPIVSIAGFAKLLRRGGLSSEAQAEYLEIIESESMRLSDMATNVLNLTKVENQAILTGVTEYNLSEQLRNCVLLLENKWTKKHLELELELGEQSVWANEELLKQVWLNLLDNAVKFSPEYAPIGVTVEEAGGGVRVRIVNTGADIPAESLDKIFRKFYQADESHASEGNGVGLAVVHRIVELHGGAVEVESGNGVTAFTVTLPKKGGSL